MTVATCGGQSEIAAMLAPLVGTRVPGGCDTCDAYQVVQPNTEHPNLWLVNVHHDDWCQTLHRKQ